MSQFEYAMKRTDCSSRMKIEKWDYSGEGCEHTELEGFCCTALQSEGIVIWMVGLQGCFCEMYEQKRTDNAEK